MDEALRAGLLDDTASETMLLFDRRQVSYPEGPWIPGYNWGIDNWFYTISGRRVRTLTVDPAEPLAAQCQDNTGARAVCVVPDDPVDWVTTARGTEARWILMTPLPSATLTASADLYTAPAAGRARLAIRSRSPVVLAALQVQWIGADGTTVASDTSALHLVRQRGNWSMLNVDVPAGAAASSGAVSEPSR
jgi:hypothetical protein